MAFSIESAYVAAYPITAVTRVAAFIWSIRNLRRGYILACLQIKQRTYSNPFPSRWYFKRHLISNADRLRIADFLIRSIMLSLTTMLHAMLSFAVKTGIISVNPADQVEPPKKDTKETQWYEPDQVAQLLNVLDQIPDIQWKTYFYISIYTGMRPGEMIGLNWSDIEGDVIHITAAATYIVGKGTVRKDSPKTKSRIRNVKLTPALCDLLKKHQVEQARRKLQFGENWPEPEAVFTTREGYRMQISSPTQKFQKILKANSLPPITLYGLRHTNATILIANGVSVRDVAAHLGHSQTSTTMNIYAHALRDSEEKAVSAFDLAMKGVRKKA